MQGWFKLINFIAIVLILWSIHVIWIMKKKENRDPNELSYGNIALGHIAGLMSWWIGDKQTIEINKFENFTYSKTKPVQIPKDHSYIPLSYTENNLMSIYVETGKKYFGIKDNSLKNLYNQTLDEGFVLFGMFNLQKNEQFLIISGNFGGDGKSMLRFDVISYNNKFKVSTYYDTVYKKINKILMVRVIDDYFVLLSSNKQLLVYTQDWEFSIMYNLHQIIEDKMCLNFTIADFNGFNSRLRHKELLLMLVYFCADYEDIKIRITKLNCAKREYLYQVCFWEHLHVFNSYSHKGISDIQNFFEFRIPRLMKEYSVLYDQDYFFINLSGKNIVMYFYIFEIINPFYISDEKFYELKYELEIFQNRDVTEVSKTEIHHIKSNKLFILKLNREGCFLKVYDLKKSLLIHKQEGSNIVDFYLNNRDISYQMKLLSKDHVLVFNPRKEKNLYIYLGDIQSEFLDDKILPEKLLQLALYIILIQILFWFCSCFY
jgi:hypothetical protein